MKLKPLSVLAIVLMSVGAVEGGRFLLKANNAFASAEKKEEKAGDVKGDPTTAYVDANPNANQMASCVPVDLAKESGISASEFKLLQALQDRRQQLDKREADIITREGVVKTADAIVMQRIETLKGVEANIQKLLGQVDEMEQKRIANLVAVYEKMKPKDAAKVWENMSDDVLLPIASRMKNQSLSLILAKVSPERARVITAKLAQIDNGNADQKFADAKPTQMAQNTPPANAPKAPAGNSTAAPAANKGPAQLAGGPGK
jgi:flagellar motility protein MotE (MotC chaperone)